MIKVLYPFVGDSLGGAQISTVELISKLSSHGVQPIILLHCHGPLSDYLDSRKIKYSVATELPTIASGNLLIEIFQILISVYSICRYFKQTDVDIVHTNDGKMHKTWLLGSKLLRKKFIWHQRSYDNSRRIGIYSLLVDQLITISEFCYSGLSSTAKTRATVVYDYMPRLQKTARSCGNSKITDYEKKLSNSKIIGYVANMTMQKRPFTFLEIANELIRSTTQPLVFVMIGACNNNLLLQLKSKLSASGLDEHFIILGNTIYIQDWISTFDVLVAPAKKEGLGRTLIEAIQLGTPVVASDDGGHKEIIRTKAMGKLIDPDDIIGFSEAILETLKDKHSNERSRKLAKLRVEQMFSNISQVHEISQSYKRVLKR